MTDTQVYSTTAINLYMSCPHAFYLQYKLKKQPKFENDVPLRVGRAVHKILEKFYDYIDPNTSQDYSEHMTNAMKQSATLYWDRTIKPNIRDEINKSLMEWLNLEKERFIKYKTINMIDKFKPLHTEKKFYDNALLIMAVVDRISQGQIGLYALDYKTNKKLPPLRCFSGDPAQIDSEYKVQSVLNTLSLRANDINIDKFLYQFVRFPNKIMEVTATQQMINEVLSQIKVMREDTTYNKNKKSCFMCSHKDNCISLETSISCI